MESTNNLQRSVTWVLWSETSQTALVIIPEEAEIIIPLIRAAKGSVYLLTYASPVTKKMLQFNNLDYYTLPPLPDGWRAPSWLKIEFGIFAGRLYFEFDE